MIRIGVSGWSYRDWRGDFYPSGLAEGDELQYAAAQFDSVEVNATFYSLPTPTRLRTWRNTVPSNFVFALKGSRYVTHNKKLVDSESAVANFIASGPLELEERLGPILWQLPKNLIFDAERIENFFRLLPKDTRSASDLARTHDETVTEVSLGVRDPNRRMRHVIEIRHESYLNQDMVTLAQRYGVAMAFSHSSAWPYLEQITTGFVYLRLHGPKRLYASAYDEEELKRWAKRIAFWAAGDEPEDAAKIIDLIPARQERDVYVYFDNDRGGLAPRQAAALRSLIPSR